MSRETVERMEAFGEALRRYQAAVDDFDRLVGRVLGVNQTDARCLEVLMFDFPHGATPADLGTALGLTSGSVTTMIDRLSASNHVERRQHPSDGRRVVVVPTDAARTAALDLHRPLVERGAELLAQYSASEIATMTDFFVRATTLQRNEEAALRARTS